MALEAHRPGPDREAAELAKWEADAFMLLVDGTTYAETRFQVSYALRMVRAPVAVTVADAFQRNARQMWKPTPPPGSSA